MSNKVVNLYSLQSRPTVFFKSLEEAEQASASLDQDTVLTMHGLWLADTKELFVLAVPEAVKITPADKFVEDVRKEKVRAAALSKLSDEEKELLGIN